MKVFLLLLGMQMLCQLEGMFSKIQQEFAFLIHALETCPALMAHLYVCLSLQAKVTVAVILTTKVIVFGGAFLYEYYNC